jgi:hypothetical protein
MIRGETTASVAPRNCTTKSLMAAMKVEPPKEGPVMTVAKGTVRRRSVQSTASPETSDRPSLPSDSGMREPRVSPRKTRG